MLITTRKINPNAEAVLCYFSTLVVEFTHTVENDVHTFERTAHQLMYEYPLHLSEHNTMVKLYFSKAYHGSNTDSIYKAISRDYIRLLREAYRVIDEG